MTIFSDKEYYVCVKAENKKKETMAGPHKKEDISQDNLISKFSDK